MLVAVLALPLTLCTAGAARAHGSIRPTSASSGEEQRFVVTVPTAGLAGSVAEFMVRVPPEAQLLSGKPPNSQWTVSIEGDTIFWRGGPSKSTIFDLFEFRVGLPEAEGVVTFIGRETYRDGAGPEFQLPITIIRGTAAVTARGGSGSLATAAVVLSGVAMVFAVAAALVVGALWLRTRAAPRHGVPEDAR